MTINTGDQDVQIVVTIKCGCGRTHSSFKAWQECPMALISVAIDPWWRVLSGEDEQS